jgi:CheY-like chemotaxis protein
VNERILLIDDDLAPIHYYLRALREAGHPVEHKRGPDEAIEYLDKKADQVDLIILDVMMPGGKAFADEKTDEGMTIGLFLLKKIRAKRPNLPILILTNLNTPELNADVLTQLGRVESARKIETDPFDLVDRVRVLLDSGNE